MECINHTGTEADHICKICQKPICLQCTMRLVDDYYCRECLENIVETGLKEQVVLRGNRKSKLLTFFLSIIPGTGHMYLGLINKGINIMCLYFAALFYVIMFSDAPSMSWFPGFFIPTLSTAFVLYSIFDSLETADRINLGEAIQSSRSFEFDALGRKLWDKKKLIGYTLIILGLVPLCNTLLGFFEKFMVEMYGINMSFMSLIPAFVLIAFGLYLIKKSKNQ